ncbi:MAG TPA: sigma-70 family RNA polymerase sigma factor [Bryobacteraceae bacterium]|nr:sigma-70 family RNA polymerase sigma factor [Bryobacteraceae bacterium]
MPVADSTLGFHLDCSTDSRAYDAAAGYQPEDGRLLEGLREGREAAYEELIERYQQPVYNLVYRLVDEPADAADVVQEVFLKIFRNITAFRGDSSLKTWIYRISCNEAYNQRRWFTRHRRKEVGLDAGEHDGSPTLNSVLPDRGRSAFDIVCDREMCALIEDALTELNPQFRAAVVLRDIEDLSYEEIAEVLQVSLGTVKSRILRGREALRKALTGRLRPESSLQFTPEPAR